jgi:hypothetical protein
MESSGLTISAPACVCVCVLVRSLLDLLVFLIKDMFPTGPSRRCCLYVVATDPLLPVRFRVQI